ncbi:MAG: DUF3575 domain-containing protein [Psychroserpens sp.]|uniref:DUF3575 domain-containing protein n=1 Tax=Psychroserpens sp. TaxID=2020870 RepID=UPI0030031F8E
MNSKNVFTAIIVLLFLKGYAQEIDKQENYFKNEVGLEVSDLLNGAMQLKYERLIGKHLSVGLGIGLKGKNGIIRLSGLNTDQVKTSDITYSGFKIIPEVRYYINKTQQYAMDGFYFGAYLKYTNFKSDLDGTYINDADESFIIEFDAEINITSIGFMVGYKLPIGKRFSIDFLIAGPGAGFHKYSLINKRDLPDEFYTDLNEALEQYSLYDILDGDFRFSATNEKADFVLPSFRYGISVGYSF